MPKMPLHVFDRGVGLHMCGRGAPESLEGNPGHSGLHSQWLEVPLQEIADAKGRTSRVGK